MNTLNIKVKKIELKWLIYLKNNTTGIIVRSSLMCSQKINLIEHSESGQILLLYLKIKI